MTAVPDDPLAQRIFATIEDLVALAPRATGTPGGLAAADYVRRRFDAAGLTTEVMTTDSYSWQADHCSVHIDGQPVPASPVLHSGLVAHDWTGQVSHRLDAPVIDIGSGGIGAGHGAARGVTARDVRGKIVLFDLTFDMRAAHTLPLTMYLHDPRRELLTRDVLGSRNPYITSLARTMRAAAAAGALGIIGVLRDYPESLSYHNEYYRRTLFPLPGAWITRATGTRLRERLRPDSTATLALDVTRSSVTARTVIGLLPGRSRDTVMVQSHHDSITSGAVEDASGTAEVIALADHYGAAARAGVVRDKTLMFVTFDTHFTGYQAHMEFARRHVLARHTPWNIVLNATIEHIGLRSIRGDDGAFVPLRQTEPRGIFLNVNPALTVRIARAIRRHGLHSTSLIAAELLQYFADGIPTDASFTFVSGVPTISLISGPLYLYDDTDTLDRIDIDQLAPVARFFVDVLDDADRRRGSTLGVLPAKLRRLLPRGRW